MFRAVGTTVLFVSTHSSTFFIISLTFERFYSIIRPHKAASFNTIRRAKIIIICIVIIIYIVIVLPAFLSSSVLCAPPVFPLHPPPPSQPSFTLPFWKFKLLFNNLPRKSFGSLHSIARYGLQNHICCSQLHLFPPSPHSPPCTQLFFYTFTERSRNCTCKTFIHCASILCKQIYLLEDEICTLRSTPLTER